MSNIEVVLFDAANTLIHKPALWENMSAVFQKHECDVDMPRLKYHHKLLSELIAFPDRTSEDFYKNFNAELLYSLGIVPEDQLLTDLFKACTYLPWKPFDDALTIRDIQLPKAILSNFNKSLTDLAKSLFGDIFTYIIVSEDLGVAKPNLAFFERAVEMLGVDPKNILYIGDSVKLDMEPALKLGMQAYLIDRENIYKSYPTRMVSLSEVENLLTKNYVPGNDTI